MSQMAPAVRLRSAVALIGSYPALAGVDLDLDKGEVALLRGPNGAGKTSILRVCAGLLAVVDGEAEVLGEDLRADRRGVRRRVGLLGHSGHLYEDLTVAENVRFAVRAAGADPAAVGPALARLELDGRLARLPAGRLSAGQRRRVALAALVARSPELWLLDEPHAGLDVTGRAAIDGVVREAAGAGCAVLLASHDLDRAAALSDKVVRVAGGQVQHVAYATGAGMAARTRDVEKAAGVGDEPVVADAPIGEAAVSQGHPLHVA